MAQDPEKLAQLQALANGGPAGLAQHQQAAAGAQAARNQALASAAGYGSPDYATSAELQSSLSATAGRAAAPGVAAAESVSAAAPGLAAMDSAAADTYTSRASRNVQSRLASAQAKIDMEERRDRAEQQSKLAELQLEREKMAAEGAYSLASLDEKSRALDLERAMDPERIKGQAMKDQAAAVEQQSTSAAFSGLGGQISETLRKAMEGAQGNLAREAAEAEAKVKERPASAYAGLSGQGATGSVEGDPSYISGGLDYDQRSQRDPALVFRDEAAATRARMPGQETVEYQTPDGTRTYTRSGNPGDLKAAAARAGSLQEQLARNTVEKDQETQNLGADVAMTELSRPRFEFQAAIERGMDPDVAASKFLAGESGNRERDWAIRERERQYQADTIDDRLEQREMTLEQKQAAQARQAEAEAEAERTGWDPKDLVSMAGATNLSVKDVADRVTSDAWKKVDQYAKKAGEGGYVLDSADANKLGEPESVGQPMDEDIFWKYLGLVPGLDPMARQIAYKRYKWMFAPIPEDEGGG